MNRSEHLTDNQLTDYFGDALERAAKHAVGRHLLQCDFCLKRLPQPTPEQFMAALMTENETDEDSQDKKSPFIPRLGFLAHLLKQPKIFALSSAGVLAVCLVFSAFIWLSAAKSSDAERELAENFEPTQSVEQIINNDKRGKSSTLPPAEPNENSTPVSVRPASNRNLPAAKEIKPKQIPKTALRNDSNIKTQSNSPSEDKVNISSTRGGAASVKCSELQPIELAIGMNNETVTLKWKKIPNAAKYHLYVSDEEEILVDEFESEQETTYALKKPLAPQKTYQWKVVVTLEDGKTIVGDAQKFTIKDLQSNQKKSDRREKSVIRCSESKLNR